MNGISQFKVNLNTFPKSSLDFKFICVATYAEYKILLGLTGALMLPLSFVHENLQSAIAAINGATYKTLKKNLDHLNGAMKGILKTPIKDLKNMSADIGNIGQALSNNCEFFLSSLPNSMFDIFQDLQYGLADITNGLIKLPNAITNSIFNSLMKFKMDALQSVFGATFSTLLQPFIAYENFLKEHGVVKMIDTMNKMEICMMKPGVCHREPSFYTDPVSRKTWSKYYKAQMFMNSNGTPNFNLLANNTGNDPKHISSVHKNLTSFLKF